MAVRVSGSRQRHHRRQAAGIPVGDGVVGQAVRVQRVHDAATAGVDGRGAVAVLYAAVRRVSGPGAGLIAGAALAVTPGRRADVPVQQPRRAAGSVDGGLLRTASCEPPRQASTRWIALAGCAIGFAFLTKMLQAFLVVPGLALAFLVAAPVGIVAAVGKLLVGAGALVVSAGWYRGAGQPLARECPALHRWLHRQQPAAVGLGLQRHSTHGRRRRPWRRTRPRAPCRRRAGRARRPWWRWPTCSSAASPASAGCSARRWARGVVAAARRADRPGGRLWFTRRAARTDGVRAGLLLWGGWLLVTAAVFSFMDGIIHPTTRWRSPPRSPRWSASRCDELWRGRSTVAARLVLAVMSAAPASGRSSCSTARRTGCPRCAGSCWSARSWWRRDAGRRAAHRLRPAQLTVLAAAALLFGHSPRRPTRSRRVATAHSGPSSTSGPSKGNPPFGTALVRRPRGPGGGDDGQRRAGRTGAEAPTTVGPQQLSVRWARAIWSCGPAPRSWRSVASPAATTRPRWQQFQDYVADARFGTSSPADVSRSARTW